MAGASGCEMSDDHVAEAREPITQTYDTEPELKRGGEPGELIVDARSGRDVFVMSEKGMTFDSHKDLFKFLGEKLHADPVRNKKGEVTGMRGRLVSYGTPYFADLETKAVYAVDDYIEATLGGRNGIVTIDKEPFCIRPDVCGDTKEVANRHVECDGPFCASGESFKHEFPGASPRFVRVGATTRREVGGFRIEHSFCMKGFIPWICSTQVGSNTLRVAAQFLINPELPLPSGYILPAGRSADNADSVSMSEWEIGIDDICGTAGGETLPPVCSIDDICATHVGEASPGGDVEFDTDLSNFCDELAEEKNDEGPLFEFENPFD
jgi:hypothetical protein